MIADNSIVLKYSAKTVSIEPFIIGVTWKSRSRPSIKQRGTAQRLFQKLSERTAGF